MEDNQNETKNYKDILIEKSEKRYQELSEFINDSYNQIILEIKKTNQLDFLKGIYQQKENEMINPDQVMCSIKKLFKRMIEFKNGTIDKLKMVDQTISQKGDYDKYCLQLEKQIKDLIKEQDKLILSNEIAQLTIEDYKNITQNIQNNLIKQKQENLKKDQQLEILIENRQNNLSQQQKSVQLNNQTKNKEEQKVMIELMQSDKQSILKNIEKILMKNDRRQVKDLEDEKYINQEILRLKQNHENDLYSLQYENERLRNQLEQIKIQNIKLEKSSNQKYNEIKDLKNEISQIEKRQDQILLTGNNNSKALEKYRNDNHEYKRQIKELENKKKKFTIFEKKLKLKERAFQVERMECHNKINDMDERIQVQIQNIKRLVRMVSKQEKKEFQKYIKNNPDQEIFQQ